jgi:hypothetical protein
MFIACPKASPINVSAKRLYPVSLLLATSLSLLTGCGREVSSGTTAKITPSIAPSAEESLTHDAGEVISGEPVSHDFVIRNTSNGAMEILSDADIRLNCGCSSLVPAARRIEAGTQTHVEAKVETRGKRGPFAHGGSIVWTSVSGVQRPISFAIRGKAVLPIESAPEVVRFDPTETRKGEVKEFVLTPNVPVDWGSLKWSSSSPQIQVLESQIEGRALRCKARCVLPEGQETLQGTLNGFVDVHESKSPPITFAIHVLAEQTVDLVIVPKTVPIVLPSNGENGKARLLLHGELVGHEKPYIREIRCQGFRVNWSANKPTPSKKAVLDMTFEPTEKGRASDVRIQIDLVTGKTIILPAVLVRPRMVRD